MIIPDYLRKIPDEDAYILHTPSFNSFVDDLMRWEIATRRLEILEAVKVFFHWYIDYVDAILKGKTYGMDGVAAAIFRLEFKTPNHELEFLRKSIYISKAYVGHLLGSVSSENIHRYQHTLTGLGIDLEELILNYEVNIRKSIPRGQRRSGRRKDLSVMDLWSAARTIFTIEDRNGVEELYLRDVKPLVIFQIRQLIELYGNDILGYYEIRNDNGTVNKRMTHEAWKFITEEVKRTDAKIILPFNVDIINHVSNWANNFVHTTYLYSPYIQFYALEVISVLFDMPPAHIKTFDGKRRRLTGVAAIEIRDYYELRRRFEAFLRKKVNGVKVLWLDPSNVRAYIIELGEQSEEILLPWWRRLCKRVFSRKTTAT